MKLTGWPNRFKTMQRNWTQVSGHGKLHFPYDTDSIGEQGKLKVFYYPA